MRGGVRGLEARMIKFTGTSLFLPGGVVLVLVGVGDAEVVQRVAVLLRLLFRFYGLLISYGLLLSYGPRYPSFSATFSAFFFARLMALSLSPRP